MGVRLYLNTEDTSVLARVLGVPVETFARLEEIETRHKLEAAKQQGLNAASMQDFQFEQYLEINDDPILNPVYNYQVFGFHKLSAPCYIMMLAKNLDPDCGSTTDLELAQLFLDLQGVDLNGVSIEETGGVNWG